MDKFELIAPCHFGMEAVLKREILDLGYEITKVEDGKVTFQADAQGIADANMFLRSTERILLKVAEVKAQRNARESVDPSSADVTPSLARAFIL